jgi:hypothetical protein
MQRWLRVRRAVAIRFANLRSWVGTFSGTGSAGPQEHGALQYPVADAAKTPVVPQRPAHIVCSTAAEKDQAHVAQRLPICQARHAHELLGSGGVIGMIVLIPNE